MKSPILTIAATALLAISSVTFANTQTDALADLGKNAFPQWLNNDVLVELVKAQNEKNAGLSEAEIIALDKKWRAETGSSSQPLINDVLGNSLSDYLAQVKEESAGLYTEIFVMDAKGLNVGQSDVTSDYWQGDEAKWQKTYLEGPTAVHVGDIEMDESTQQFQAQVSVSVVDPASGNVIGAVTVGVNVDAL